MIGSESVEKWITIMCCPWDRGGLSRRGDILLCRECGSEYPVLGGNVFDLVSRGTDHPDGRLTSVNWCRGYRQALRQASPTDLEEDVAPLWGDLDRMPSGFGRFVRREVEMLRQELTGGMGLLCDVGAGTGNYSIALASSARAVAHCDFDLPSIGFARRRAVERGVDNLLFVRCDYLALPFRDSVFDTVLSIDTLERGEMHDRALMAEAVRVARPGARIAVDFHNPRFGFLNRVANSGLSYYGLREIGQLMSRVGVDKYELRGCGYLPQRLAALSVLGRLEGVSARVLPPARHVVLGRVRGLEQDPNHGVGA